MESDGPPSGPAVQLIFMQQVALDSLVTLARYQLPFSFWERIDVQQVTLLIRGHFIHETTATVLHELTQGAGHNGPTLIV